MKAYLSDPASRMNSSMTDLLGALRSRVSLHGSARLDSHHGSAKLPCVGKPKYKLQDKIAKGGFSVVYTAKKDKPMFWVLNKEYAAKVFDLAPDDESDSDSDSTYIPEAVAALKRIQQKKMERAALRAKMAALEGVVARNGECKQQKKAVEEEAEKEESTKKTDRSIVLNEIRILKYLRGGKHVIKLHDYFEVKNNNENKLWIITEKLEISLQLTISNLLSQARSSKPHIGLVEAGRQLPIETVACIIHKVLKALAYLRSKRIVHRDVKPGNILISSRGQIKLCDFGIAVQLPEGEDVALVERVVGTRRYMASELTTLGQAFDYSADIWGAGVVLFNLFDLGKSPINGIDFLQGFRESLWADWARSDELYFSSFLGPSFLSQKEQTLVQEQKMFRRQSPTATSTVTKKPLPSKLTAYERNKSVTGIVRRAMIPLPKNGPDGNIHREGLSDRISLEEFLVWAESKISQLTPNQRVERIRSCMEAASAVEPQGFIVDPVILL